MKHCALLFISILFQNILFGQTINPRKPIDSMVALLNKPLPDTTRVKLLTGICNQFVDVDVQESIRYGNMGVRLAQKIEWPSGLGEAEASLGRAWWRSGNFEIARKYHFNALQLARTQGNNYSVGRFTVFIGQDYADEGNYTEALKYFTQAYDIFRTLKDKMQLGIVMNLFSWVYSNQGNYAESSRWNYESMKIYEELHDDYGVAVSMSNIASDAIQLGNYSEALVYSKKSIRGMLAADAFINVGETYNSIGSIYQTLGNIDSAFAWHQKALALANKLKNNNLIGDSYKGLGNVLYAKRKFREAIGDYSFAADLYVNTSNNFSLASVYNNIAGCYISMHEFGKAKEILAKIPVLARNLESNVWMVDYYQGMTTIDSAGGHWKDAFFNSLHFMKQRDSVINLESTRKVAQANWQYENDKVTSAAKVEQDKKDVYQRTVRNTIVGVLVGVLIFLAVVYRQRNKVIAAKKRSDELLLNILPAETAEELKKTGSTTAKGFDHVTVLFTDFKNFTLMSEKLSAQELVNEINYCYSAFDTIISRYSIEKIKTIGDSYMCAGGLPTATDTHAEDTVNAALDIRGFIDEELEKRKASGKPFFEIRIGCHTGPVVAGIVGIKKFAYDIWGDTVNIASRMESSGQTGKVNISGATYEEIKDKFDCIYRGKIEAKNKGEIDMYFVERKSSKT